MTITVPEAGRMVGLTRNAAYAAAQRGEIPTLRFGGLLRVPIAAWLRKIEEPETPRIKGRARANPKGPGVRRAK
ncbi:helix-turn-helix domain-containing protein [Bradyrhizobium sp. BR 1432]|uniref:helix-turn-helix domain-containing protein n=1 Tax=Bradyrhizobium sp. BR 1432 TaxID=3447966 RepID=UPI003EE6E2E5